MDEYEISLPKSKKKLIKLNTYPKENPYKDFDDSLEVMMPKKLYTPLKEIRPLNLLEKIVESTSTEKEVREKEEPVSWLRKFTFAEGSTLENRTNKVHDIKEPINFERVFEESFVDVDEDLTHLNTSEFKPGKEKYLLFDVDETNFEIESMTEHVLGYPSKVTLKNDDGQTEYTCFANNLQDHYLLEVTDDCVYYYPMSNSLKLKKIKKRRFEKEDTEIKE